MLKLKIFLENSCVTKKLAYLYTMTNAQNNNTMNAQNKLNAAIAKQDTKTLKESAVLLMQDLSREAGVALCAVLDVLEARLGEDEFTQFANTL